MNSAHGNDDQEHGAHAVAAQLEHAAPASAASSGPQPSPHVRLAK